MIKLATLEGEFYLWNRALKAWVDTDCLSKPRYEEKRGIRGDFATQNCQGEAGGGGLVERNRLLWEKQELVFLR